MTITMWPRSNVNRVPVSSWCLTMFWMELNLEVRFKDSQNYTRLYLDQLGQTRPVFTYSLSHWAQLTQTCWFPLLADEISEHPLSVRKLPWGICDWIQISLSGWRLALWGTQGRKFSYPLPFLWRTLSLLNQPTRDIQPIHVQIPSLIPNPACGSNSLCLSIS